VNIGGYSIQYAAANDATANGYAVCTIAAADTVIEPGTYFLIAFGPVSSSAGTAIPNANLVCPTAINLSDTGGKLVLVNNATALNGTSCPPASASIIDFVGYGTTANCFETAPALIAENVQSSMQRTPTGKDTNNNRTDFASGAATPTAAAANATPTPTPTPSPTPSPTP